MAKNYFGITDKGRVRSNNEDTFIAQPVCNNQLIAACVIDGVGGYEGGEVAAHLAHDTILSYLQKGGEEIIERMKEALIAANATIYNEKQVSKENAQMACVLTLALADTKNNKFYYAHVGDTRLYLLRDQSLVKVTHDHSFVGFLEDNGKLSEEAAMKHPKRNEINKALGFDPNIPAQNYIETGESPFLPGDTLLLCSDGLTDMIDNRAITTVLNEDRPLSTKGEALIEAANNAGGRDNITVVLVHNNKPPLQQSATKPVMAIKNNDEVEDKERLVEIKPGPGQTATKNSKRSSSLPLFIILGILILATLIWFIYQNNNDKKQNSELQNNLVVKKRNPQEQLFADSINGSKTNEVFVLNQAGALPIIITDSILVNRDSLHIIGNGVKIKSDTAYHGVAFSLSSSSKYILLDSLSIEGFDIGVLVKNQSLHLKNVHFTNCRIPVQQNFMFGDTSVVNGRFADTLFYNTEVNSQ